MTLGPERIKPAWAGKSVCVVNGGAMFSLEMEMRFCGVVLYLYINLLL